MKQIFKVLVVLIFISNQFNTQAQNYYYESYQPFDTNIPTPEEFLEYPIGDYHTRHDLVVAYFYKLAEVSDRATITVYGRSNENRKLIMFTVTTSENHGNLNGYKEKHEKIVEGTHNITDFSDLPIFINLGYGVHGNEPSSTEAAMLTAYTLVASKSEKVQKYLKEAVIFIDPTINPDGRDRFTNWVNVFKGSPVISDSYDIEHNEGWPRGRTNHYWFDLNRDWLLAVQPESNAKLKWFHEWHPNVVTDFHEMGTSSTYFFEPKQLSASLTPITPEENYTTLNDLFAEQYSKDLDAIGSLYFTSEKYDATYPGYGSTYADLHGSLALLFEQASARGHLQETPTGEMSFAFTIKNQFVSSFSTIVAGIKNKDVLYDYQQRFYLESKKKAAAGSVKGYVFGDNFDKNRTKAFIDLLLKHQIEAYPINDKITINNKTFNKESGYFVPTEQDNHYMVQTMFETYNKYRDSVYYDASAWSLVNFYNMNYEEVKKAPAHADVISADLNSIKINSLQKSNYAYVISWDDYYAPALLYQLQKNNVIVKVATKEFTVATNGKNESFDRGSLLISVGIQNQSASEIFEIVKTVSTEFNIQAYPVATGISVRGIDLGSSNFKAVKQPKVMMVVEGGVSSYEAGEVWHLFEQRMKMPITKIPERILYRADLSRYNTIILVSGSYSLLTEATRNKLKDWVSKGNTLITSRTASSWVIRNKIVNEALITSKKDSSKTRLNYGESREHIGRNSIGGAIFEVDLDITHPIGYGYHKRTLPVYKNNRVWLAPSKNNFSTVAKYTEHPHIDGYVTQENLDKYMSKSASIIVSRIGKGRVVLFADNPNFRGAWYGTNKLFMNAIFFGQFVRVP
ncbi:MAG: zinc carboxypeptidase [Flavobacteriaceae bacterium]|nr:MAG: zinc carboxypeptidase [Flavobacteriaceae bacterium]